MRTLMDGEVWVHYAQVYVESLRAGERVYPDLAACFAGQSNGLCGAAVPGVLFLTTGLHTGRVPFRAELHDEPPPFPFDHDDRLAWILLRTDEAPPRTTVTSLDGATGNMRQQFAAFPALLHARDPDPLNAAVRALLAGANTFGHDQYQELLDEVRREFPVLKQNRLS